MLLMSTRMCIICCSELINGYYAGTKTKATFLADKFNMNIRTLNPSLNKLIKAGILKSQVGGVDRGYTFNRDPKEVTIYDIIYAVQGFDFLKNCKDAIEGSKCNLTDCTTCKLFDATNSILEIAQEKYKSITIFDLFMKEQ